MKITSSTHIALSAALLASAQTAFCNDIGITKKLMEFDVTQPAREDYQEVVIGANLIDEAVRLAWRQAGDDATARLVQWLSAPDRFGAGMSASEIRVTLGRPASIALQPGAADHPRLGKLAVTIPANRIELISTHPASRGRWMHPHTLFVFDLSAVIDIGIVASAPYVRASQALVAVDKVMVLPLNELSALGLSADRRLPNGDSQTAHADVIAQAFRAADLPMAGTFNDQLRAMGRHLPLPQDETFNGGAVEGARIVIAAFKAKPAKEGDVAISTSWHKSLGELMNDCAPVGAGARWISGPKPYGGGEAPRQAAHALRAYPRADGGENFSCLSIVRVPSGAPVEITWRQPIHLGPNEALAEGVTIEATPVNFGNPVQFPDSQVHQLALGREMSSKVQALRGSAVSSQAITSAAAGDALRLSRSDLPRPALPPVPREPNK